MKNVKVQLSQQGESIEAVVRDAVNTFNFQRRSDGFKRFFTFLLMVSVKAKTKTLTGTLYLHDEPEISLHPSGAQYLRDELISISAHNDVVYSTHSIFMIDRRNIGRHLIVKRENEVTTLLPVDQSNFMEEEVLYNALNWSVFESLQLINIVFEGWRDHRLFAVACKKPPSAYRDVVKVIGDWGSCYAKGVTDARRVAAMLQLANRKCFIVSDADKTARDQQASYDGFGEWFRYDELGAARIVTGEDFITADHFEAAAKKFLAGENPTLAPIQNFPPIPDSGRLDALRNWLTRQNVPDVKGVLERFKTELFDGLKVSHIDPAYFNMLRELAAKIKGDVVA